MSNTSITLSWFHLLSYGCSLYLSECLQSRKKNWTDKKIMALGLPKDHSYTTLEFLWNVIHLKTTHLYWVSNSFSHPLRFIILHKVQQVWFLPLPVITSTGCEHHHVGTEHDQCFPPVSSINIKFCSKHNQCFQQTSIGLTHLGWQRMN